MIDFLSQVHKAQRRQFQGKCCKQALGNSSRINRIWPSTTVTQHSCSVQAFCPSSCHHSQTSEQRRNNMCGWWRLSHKADVYPARTPFTVHTVRQLKCHLSTVNGLFLENAIKLFSKLPILVNFNYLNTKLQYFISQIKINLSSDAKLVKLIQINVPKIDR